jgi:hypothetical protein
MTVFASDNAMRRVPDIVVLVFMALNTNGSGLVFNLILLPLGLIGFAVPPVHIAAFINTEIARY